jgi:transposase
MQITTIGLDLAKNEFQVHGVDAEGRVVVRRKLRRAKVRQSICEAVMRSQMRFVPIKTEDQQAALMLHKARELLGSSADDADQRHPRTYGLTRHDCAAGLWENQGSDLQ